MFARLMFRIGQFVLHERELLIKRGSVDVTVVQLLEQVLAWVFPLRDAVGRTVVVLSLIGVDLRFGLEVGYDSARLVVRPSVALEIVKSVSDTLLEATHD